MNDAQVGSAIRAVRIRRGLRQSDVAVSAGVSQALVSAVENGNLERTSLYLVRRVAATVGISLPVAPRWRGAELPKLLGEKHAVIVREVVARLATMGWHPLPEQTFNLRGERGSIDVLGWQAAARAVLVVEVKPRIDDLQDLLSTLDRKRRLAPALARDLGWKPLLVGAALVLPEEHQARASVEAFASVFDAALPARTLELRRWLVRPSRDVRGIWFLPIFTPGSTGRRRHGSCRVRAMRQAASGGGARSDSGSRSSSRGGQRVGA
jgi:transcriptional regulator with XRE-family HTH domain